MDLQMYSLLAPIYAKMEGNLEQCCAIEPTVSMLQEIFSHDYAMYSGFLVA